LEVHYGNFASVRCGPDLLPVAADLQCDAGRAIDGHVESAAILQLNVNVHLLILLFFWLEHHPCMTMVRLLQYGFMDSARRKAWTYFRRGIQYALLEYPDHHFLSQKLLS